MFPRGLYWDWMSQLEEERADKYRKYRTGLLGLGMVPGNRHKQHLVLIVSLGPVCGLPLCVTSATRTHEGSWESASRPLQASLQSRYPIRERDSALRLSLLWHPKICLHLFSRWRLPINPLVIRRFWKEAHVLRLRTEIEGEIKQSVLSTYLCRVWYL